MLKRMIRRYGERVGDADEVDLAEMLEVERAMQEAIRTAVRLQIAAGRSWSEVATGLGTTKQAAHLRFGPASNRMSPV